MRTWMLALVTSAVTLQAAAATAACAPPDTLPTVPNGETATREEMLAAQASMKAFNAAVAEYTQCVQKDGGSEIELNRVVNQLEKVAARFNAELRKFKQKAGK